MPFKQPAEMSKSHPPPYLGLSSIEATELLTQYGYNERKAARRSTWLSRFFHIITEPMVLFLLGSVVVYFFLGDHTEATILIATIIPIGFMEFFQQQRTDQAVQALNAMLKQYCMVYRDGSVQKIDIKYLVPGDLVHITAGDKIPADGYIVHSPGLLIDESVLTGESIAVVKSATPDQTKTIAEEHCAWQGSLVVNGEGSLYVTATAEKTKYGKIGQLLGTIKNDQTPLQKRLHKLVKTLAVIALTASIAVSIILSFKQNILQGILGGLTIAITLIPEEFPIVFSVFLIMGVWHMTKQGALIREMTKVEILGSTTVICSDKTGTLTQGTMALKKIYCGNKTVSIDAFEHHETAVHECIAVALLGTEQIAVDPIDIEIQRVASLLGVDHEKLRTQYTLAHDVPFNAKTKLVHHTWKNENNEFIQFSAGAPESIFKYSTLDKKEMLHAKRAFELFSSEGYRVIGVARRAVPNGDALHLENLEFIGMLAMYDPPRAGVTEAINLCQNAGIRIIMITGDNQLTAHSIAEQIGIKHNEILLTGTELSAMSPDAMNYAVKQCSIFARIQPEQKYSIVKALQENGEIVAMTGDGVNDAPALKQADIGIAMGAKGTEVAREAADMILSDDNFATIVNAVKEGRRIYDNLRSAFAFLVSFHIPIIGLAFLSLSFGKSLIFSPLHVIFLELICDPVAVIGLERERARKGLMLERPRPITEPFLPARLWFRILLQGIGILTVSFGFYYYYTMRSNQALGRTMAFISLVFMQVLVIILSREWHQIKSNKLLLTIIIATIVLITAILSVPWLRNLFYLTTISYKNGVLAVGIPLITALLIRLVLHLKKA